MATCVLLWGVAATLSGAAARPPPLFQVGHQRVRKRPSTVLGVASAREMAVASLSDAYIPGAPAYATPAAVVAAATMELDAASCAAGVVDI